MNFLTGVNRLLRINGIIAGDDDAITSFDDTQHAADIELAQIAIQDELTDLISERLIPYEKTSSTINLVTSTRNYALQTNFMRFYGENPSFYDSTDNVRIYEYPGGEDSLRDADYQYATTEGSPVYWYWYNTTTKQIGFYNVPSSEYNGRSLSYDYEKSVSVSSSSDTLPFISEEEAQTFISCAARRFKFMDGSINAPRVEDDATYASAKIRLLNLLRNTNPASFYGRRY